MGIAALARHPLHWWGVALALLGTLLFVLEAKYPTRGMLAITGAIALTLGAIWMIDSSEPSLCIRPGIAIAVSIPFAAITTFLFSVAVRARRNKAITQPRSRSVTLGNGPGGNGRGNKESKIQL